MLTIDLLRHGKSVDNAKGIYSNSLDDPLDASFADSIEKIKNTLSHTSYEFTYSSPYKRCIETAEGVLQQKNNSVELVGSIQEMKLGPWAGMSPSDIATRYPEEWKLWNTKPNKLLMPGRETIDDVRSRVIPWFLDIVQSNKNKHILVVTHVAIIRTVISHYLPIAPEDFRAVLIPYLKLYRLEFYSSLPNIWELNDSIYHGIKLKTED